MPVLNGSKMARHTASIVARTNVCGGVKKNGLAPSVGLSMVSNPNMIRATNSKHAAQCNPLEATANPSQSALRYIRRY